MPSSVQAALPSALAARIGAGQHAVEFGLLVQYPAGQAADLRRRRAAPNGCASAGSMRRAASGTRRDKTCQQDRARRPCHATLATRRHRGERYYGQLHQDLVGEWRPKAIVTFGWSAGISLSALPSA